MRSSLTLLRLHAAFAASLAPSLIIFLTGCGGAGGGNSGSGGTGTPSPTAVTLMLSSTANDQLQSFNLQLESRSLTSKSGNTVNIFATPPYTGFAEFIHLNGLAEPVLTMSVPQDTYTSATATVASANFTCVNLDPSTGGLNSSTFAYGVTPESQVTVNVPQAIDVNSVPMGLSLNLQASPSATYGTCDVSGIDPFNLTPIVFGNPLNSLVSTQATTLTGIVSSVDVSGSSFSVTTADHLTYSVATQSTTFQNVSGLSALVTGTPVEMDLLIGEKGTISANRVQVLDSSPTNLTIITGPVEFASSGQPVLITQAVQQQGYLVTSNQAPGTEPVNIANTNFQISGYLNNLAKLPFTPVFSAATLVPGQKVTFTTHATTPQGGPTYVPVTTATLAPQTINGIVTGITTSGSGTSTITAYTVSLAPYDLFPALAVQAGQSTLLSNPSIVTVYTIGAAAGIQNITLGNPFRFTGLVFNDNGLLKMDCLQILAGVPE